MATELSRAGRNRRLRWAINRTRLLRVMRKRKLVQRRARMSRAAADLGSSRSRAPAQLSHLDMTSISVAEQRGST